MQTEQLAERITPEVVVDLVALAWQTFVGADPIPFDDVQVVDDSFCASIGIGGPWQGTVLLECSRTAALNVAAAVLGDDPEHIADEDVRDIMGELANIVGGNLKGVASADEKGWTLTLPVVSAGTQTVPGTRRFVRVGFICDGEPLTCEVREHA